MLFEKNYGRRIVLIKEERDLTRGDSNTKVI